MDLNFNHQLSQEQRLFLTTEMQVSLKVLQMPIQELHNYINAEMNENPFLETVSETISGEDFRESEYDKSEVNSNMDAEDNPSNSDYDFELKSPQISASIKNPEIDPLNFICKPLTLKEYLYEQLRDIDEPNYIISICKFIIESIDERGYFTEDLDQTAKTCHTSADNVIHALQIIQSLSPIGVGARDLKENLKIQLRNKNINDSKIFEIIDHYLELAAENKLKVIANHLRTDIYSIEKYIRVIKTLNPKPSRGFYTGEAVNYVLPEACIKKIGSDYFVIMNDDILPKLKVNPLYRDIIKRSEDKQALDYVNDKVKNASHLIKGIDQRRNTLYRVIEKIIVLQKDYMEHGENWLKPMNYKDLAAELNLHESTISRAVKDKYITSPRGIIALKDLFPVGINTGFCKEDISTKRIKNEIKRFIQEENPVKPLSDQQISNLLSDRNMGISRRTVTKYREELDIPSSGKRRIFTKK